MTSGALPGTLRFQRFLARYPQLSAEPQTEESLARRYNSRVPAGGVPVGKGRGFFLQWFYDGFTWFYDGFIWFYDGND